MDELFQHLSFSYFLTPTLFLSLSLSPSLTPSVLSFQIFSLNMSKSDLKASQLDKNDPLLADLEESFYLAILKSVSLSQTFYTLLMFSIPFLHSHDLSQKDIENEERG